MLLLLSIAASIAAFATDSFTIKPVEVELDKNATIEFNLENDQDFVGFQADVTLPAGIEVTNVTLSDRATAAGEYNLKYNKISNGALRITAFSGKHTAFSGNDGVLVKMEVKVADSYEGGEIKVSKIIFTDSNNKDVELDDTSLKPSVKLKGISFRRTALELNIGESVTLTPIFDPEIAKDKISWKSSDETVATVSEEGEVTAVKVGTAEITATSKGLTATCTVSVKTGIVSVTSISISPASLELTEDETVKLTATITPENATGSITWHSSKESVATVDENGNVTAIKAGTTTITAESSNGKTATCEVTVKAKIIAVESVKLDKTTISLDKGKTVTLIATVGPENATDPTVTWTSSDETVATVKDGIVTAVKEGTATITAKAGDKTATCTVTVTIGVDNITLNKTTATLTEGGTVTLTATVTPDDATDKSVTWTSSDETVATVKDGVVTAVKAGTATITAKAGDKTATCTVTVNANVAVTGVTLSETILSLFEGENATLTAKVTPDNATDKSVSWSSDNESVATVKNGVVTAVAVGTATITVTASGNTASCKVTVKADDRTKVPVKMTYISKDDADKAFGEIVEGETAETGFNKISGGKVEFANEGWGVNFITYLQVDASKIEGNITSVNLTFEGSGAVNGSRTICYGVGYNSSVWAADMTYNTADRNITLIGETKWTTSKSGTSFDKLSFDITEAVKESENGIATILIYSISNAGGGYIKNPVVLVEATTAPTYDVTFKETNGAEVTVKVNNQDVTKGTKLPDGSYIFSATAEGYKNYTGEFTVEGAAKEVSFTMIPKETWNYTVKANVDDVTIATGSDLEGANIKVPYSRYIIAKDRTVWMKDATNKEYSYSFTLNTDKIVETINYSKTDMSDGIYFVEGEDIEGMNVVTRDNANIRCSNAAGGYSDEVVNVYSLKPGSYKIAVGVWGNPTATFSVKAGEKEILTTSTQGWWFEEVSEEFTLEEETVLTFEGATTNKPLDYILITGKADVEATADYKVIFVDENGTEIKEAVSGNGIVGTSIEVSADDTKDFEKDGVTYIFDGYEPKNPTIGADGTTVVTVKYHKQNKVTYTVNFVDENGETLKEPETLTGDAGSKIDLSEYVNGIVVDGKVYFFVKASYAPEGDTVAEGKVVTITFEPSSKLPYSRTESDWTEADLTDWATADGITKSIDNGLNVTFGNTGWALTKEVNFTENSIVTLKASMKGGNSGRAGAYEYLQLGGVQVRLDGQSKVGTVVIGAEEFTLTGDARGGSVDIEMIIDQASKKATVTVSGSCTGTNTGKITEALPNKVVFGYNKNGGLSGDRTATLKSISISEELQVVTTADYTINYVCDGETIKTVEGNDVIGNEVTADSTITVDDQKYYVAEGATTALTVEADADNILNVNMRKAYVYNYSVKNNVTDDAIKGSVVEGESATVAYSRYILDNEGVVWEKTPGKSSPYTISFTPDKNNFETSLEYTATDIKDGIFFSEAENIDGMTYTDNKNANVNARCSNAAGGYADEAVTLYTLPAGTYKVRLGVWGNAGNTFVAKVGETTVLTAETQGYWLEAVSEEFTVETETALTFEGANSSKPLDYVLITGSLKEIVNSVVIDTKDLASEYTIGDTFKLKATVDSDNSSADPQVTWTSSKPAVATVDKAGNVKVVGAGNVRITASYGGKSASCSIKCYPQVGDAKMDGGVTIDDAVEITNFVVGKKTAPADWDKDEWTEFFTRAANANQDKEGKITFADASAAVSILIAQPIETPTQNRIAAYDNDDQDALVIGGISAADGRYSIPVTLDNSMEYVALQADIILPAGMSVEVKEGSRVAGSHIMATHKFADNHIRVALYNLGNTAFADNDAPIIEIIANGMIADNEEIAICNIIAADTDANKFVLASKAADTNGVDAIGFDSNASVKVYDLNGRYISDKVEGLEQGIYIFRQGNNAKKVRIR